MEKLSIYGTDRIFNIKDSANLLITYDFTWNSPNFRVVPTFYPTSSSFTNNWNFTNLAVWSFLLDQIQKTFYQHHMENNIFKFRPQLQPLQTSNWKTVYFQWFALHQMRNNTAIIRPIRWISVYFTPVSIQNDILWRTLEKNYHFQLLGRWQRRIQIT